MSDWFLVEPIKPAGPIWFLKLCVQPYEKKSKFRIIIPQLGLENRNFSRWQNKPKFEVLLGREFADQKWPIASVSSFTFLSEDFYRGRGSVDSRGPFHSRSMLANGIRALRS